MPTLLDNTLKSKNMVLAFGGVVAAATAWMLAGDLFPADPDPKGDPETWTREQMRRWLEAVSRTDDVGNLPVVNNVYLQRNLFPQASDTREQLLARIQANLRLPRK
ncbi:hypothetical protein BBO_07041 [Beauveria brongniartii RCEF 3172]|uniref:STE24 endopeptidase n=1 Tax=Beauveria brongniartii RCEF 3172 TaxID=1081107 RepID=A0A166ZZQ2_9HYPO|nr:hypothetical protein BBO_07041 [Beauveria brongniartii RCEF 3172]